MPARARSRPSWLRPPPGRAGLSRAGAQFLPTEQWNALAIGPVEIEGGAQMIERYPLDIPPLILGQRGVARCQLSLPGPLEPAMDGIDRGAGSRVCGYNGRAHGWPSASAGASVAAAS